jgi:hypothetical protein
MSIGQGAALAAAALIASTAATYAQTIQTLNNQMPEIPIYGFLLTDGSAMIQGSNQVLTLNGTTWGTPAGSLSHWFKLTPDSTGSYLNGTWTQLKDAVTYATTVGGVPITNAYGQNVRTPYEPYAGGGAVLGDGRLALFGGEYRSNNFTFTLTNEIAVYDPFTNKWLPVLAPQPFNGQGGFLYFGDSVSAVLPNGSLLVGQKLTKLAVALDPKFFTWVQYGETMSSKNDFNSEEGWTLLPDGSILTADVLDAPRTERLIPNADVNSYHWVQAGMTPVILRSPPDACCIPFDNGHLVYNPPGEIGPAILRPDGTVFATGALPYRQLQAHTAIFTPGPGYTGTWTAGPDFPRGEQAGDNFGVLEPNGNVLVEGDQFYVSETAGMSGILAKRRLAERLMHAQARGAAADVYPLTHLYEFDGTNLTQLPVGVQAGASLLPLPSGQVLALGYNAQLFTPADTGWNPAWAPSISSAPSTISAGSTYRIWGTQFNGLSQACSFGDEFQCATNYPLVRITNTGTGDVIYARTHNHSTMGVATGGTPVWTWFDVPAGIETGPSTLQVVANGIPSAPVSVTVQ